MAVTNSTIDMTWTAATDNVGVVSYHIYQSTDNVVYTEIHSTDGVTYAYTAIGLSEDTKYYFKQTAKDAAGNESLYGNTVEATTLGGAPAYTYLLDDYPGAVAAYSLRKLRTGEVNAIEVRRDGASPATTNVLLYDDPSKSIDLDSITESVGQTLGEWVGGASAFIFNWYDQSGGGNHVSQTTEAIQPRIVNTGVLEVKNGVYFDGVDDYLIRNALPELDHQNTYSFFTVSANQVDASGGRIITTSLSNARMVHLNDRRLNGINFGDSSWVRYSQDRVTSDNLLLTGIVSSNLGSGWDNGQAGGDSIPITDYSNTDFIIGIDGYGLMDGTISEIIIYGSDQSANRTAIEDNINAAYNIWVVTAEVDAQLIQADNDNVSDTVIEINGVRSSASDTAVANLISRNVTVITN